MVSQNICLVSAVLAVKHWKLLASVNPAFTSNLTQYISSAYSISVLHQSVSHSVCVCAVSYTHLTLPTTAEV